MTKYVLIKKWDGDRWDMPPAHWQKRRRVDKDGNFLGWNIWISCAYPEKHSIKDSDMLIINHEIKEDGILHPSLVCPYSPKDHWHIWAKLEDWEAN